MKTDVDAIRSSLMRPIAKAARRSRRKVDEKARSPILALVLAAVTLVALLTPSVLFYVENVRRPAIYRDRIKDLANGDATEGCRDVRMLTASFQRIPNGRTPACWKFFRHSRSRGR